MEATASRRSGIEVPTLATPELLFELLPLRRLRANPRVVKWKMSNFAVKRAEHRNPPKPASRPEHTTTILAA